MRGRALLLAAALLAGCASTTVETTGSALKAPLCKPGEAPRSIYVVWGPEWRSDQKEPAERETLAQKGIEEFLAGLPCLNAVGVKRFPAGGAMPTNEQLLNLARSATPPADVAVLVVVHELGPILLIGIPVIVEGGTEVVIDVRVLETATSRTLAESRTHWKNGGTFVIKGTGSLAKDMASALRAALLREMPAP
jgi:hypothetical protein